MPSKDLWEYTLQEEDNGKKYHEILARKFHFSRKLLQSLKQGEKVWVNGNFTYLNATGRTGEILTIELHSPEEPSIPGEELPLDIIYEDEYILGINKPAGQVIHPTPRYPSGTIGNAVVGYLAAKGEYRPFRPVHRIDRNTSGVVVVAKNRFAHQQLAWQLEHNQVHKKYIGIVSGRVELDHGEIDGPIGLVPGSFIKRHVSPDGLPALTHYRVLSRFPEATLLEFVLDTGRTHQIRVHCQALGHPLLGDDFYGGDTTLIPRQALHSFLYSFTHPATGKPVSIKAPIPEDMRQLMKRLNKAKNEPVAR